jgi:hypothetical protein
MVFLEHALAQVDHHHVILEEHTNDDGKYIKL